MNKRPTYQDFKAEALKDPELKVAAEGDKEEIHSRRKTTPQNKK